MAVIAVTGARGNVGRKVVELIAEADIADVTAVMRRPLDFGGSRIRTALAAYEDVEALRTAFAGAETLVLVTSDSDAVSEMEHHQNIVTAAKDAGVSNVVSLSSIDADEASPFCYSEVIVSLERILLEKFQNVSLVRTSIFAEFFAEWVTAARKSGDIRLPAADGLISLVGRDDVAAVLASLAADPRAGTYNITGPQSLNCAEVAELGRRSYGVPMKFTDVTPQQHLIEMAQDGIDPWWMYAYSSMFQAIREQRWSLVSNDFNQQVGRSPETFGAILEGL